MEKLPPGEPPAHLIHRYRLAVLALVAFLALVVLTAFLAVQHLPLPAGLAEVGSGGVAVRLFLLLRDLGKA